LHIGLGFGLDVHARFTVFFGQSLTRLVVYRAIAVAECHLC
jgi:hypothetical protein